MQLKLGRSPFLYVNITQLHLKQTQINSVRSRKKLKQLMYKDISTKINSREITDIIHTRTLKKFQLFLYVLICFNKIKF